MGKEKELTTKEYLLKIRSLPFFREVPEEKIIQSALRKYWNVQYQKYEYERDKHQIKRVLLREQGFRCFYCLRVLTHKKATLDHVKPHDGSFQKTGKDGFVVACQDCNTKKSDMPQDVFLEIMQRKPEVVLQNPTT